MTTTREDFIDLVKDGKRYREKRGRWERIWFALTIGYWPATLLMVFVVAIFGKAGTAGKAAKS